MKNKTSVYKEKVNLRGPQGPCRHPAVPAVAIGILGRRCDDRIFPATGTIPTGAHYVGAPTREVKAKSCGPIAQERFGPPVLLFRPEGGLRPHCC